MPKCLLQIAFHRDPRNYTIGERISGFVQVTINEDCECRKLAVARQWRASGQGGTDEGMPEEEKVIFSGPWRAGQTTTYPFEIEAPPGPLTYHGALFHIDWQLRATADIPGTEATVTEGFVLLPGASAEYVSLGTLDEPPPDVRKGTEKLTPNYAGGCSQGFAIVFGLVALFAGVPCLAIGLLNILALFVPLPLPVFFPAGRLQSAFLIVMGGFFAFLGCKALASCLRAAGARSKLGKVDIELSSTTPRRGEAVTCTVRLRPRASIELTGATASLVATEYCGGGSGNLRGSAQTWKQVVHQGRATLATNRTLRAAEEVVLQTSLNLPPDAPCSFWGAHHKLIWTVAVEMKLRHWPDWSQSIPLTVRP
jgi:hypothetical protein